MTRKRRKSPFDISKELGSIRLGLFTSLRDRYHTAYVLAFSTPKAKVVDIRRTGHSDPTGDTVADKEEFRKKVDLAAHKIMEACTAFDRADEILDELTGGRYQPVHHKAGEL